MGCRRVGVPFRFRDKTVAPQKEVTIRLIGREFHAEGLSDRLVGELAVEHVDPFRQSRVPCTRLVDAVLCDLECVGKGDLAQGIGTVDSSTRMARYLRLQFVVTRGCVGCWAEDEVFLMRFRSERMS